MTGTDPSATRINRFLADCGFGSRRSCEQLVTEGRVTINGEPCLSLGTRVSETDRVSVDGRAVRPTTQEITLLMHKPAGVLCTRDDPEGRQTIFDLLPPHLRDMRSLNNAGRLDRESEGLLIMTNSGELSQRLTHPGKKLDKEYLVHIDAPFRQEHTRRMLDGIDTESGRARAVAVRQLTKRRLLIVLHQGLKRQIRLMLGELGYGVRRLVRVRIGGLVDHDLGTGCWRQLGRRDLDAVFGQNKR